jgi:hypothetical protein
VIDRSCHVSAENPESESRLRNLRILVNGLPEANKSTVFYLLKFLSKVVANEKVNRYSPPLLFCTHPTRLTKQI